MKLEDSGSGSDDCFEPVRLSPERTHGMDPDFKPVLKLSVVEKRHKWRFPPLCIVEYRPMGEEQSSARVEDEQIPMHFKM